MPLTILADFGPKELRWRHLKHQIWQPAKRWASYLPPFDPVCSYPSLQLLELVTSLEVSEPFHQNLVVSTTFLLLSGFGEGVCPLPPRCLGRLDFRVFGAQLNFTPRLFRIPPGIRDARINPESRYRPSKRFEPST